MVHEFGIVAVFRILLIVVLVMVVLRLIRRIMAPAPRQPQQGPSEKSQSKTSFRKGNIIVEKPNETKRRPPDDDGEYTDFEEIKDE